MNVPCVSVARRNGVVMLSLRDVEASRSLTEPTLYGCLQTLDVIGEDLSNKVLVLLGGGGSVASDQRQPIDVEFDRIGEEKIAGVIDAQALWTALQQFPIPVVCALRGGKSDWAAIAALHSDITIASDTGRLDYSAWPIISPFPSLAATSRDQSLVRGVRISATSAWNSGIIESVVPEESLENEIDKISCNLSMQKRVGLRSSSSGRADCIDSSSQLSYMDYEFTPPARSSRLSSRFSRLLALSAMQSESPRI